MLNLFLTTNINNCSIFISPCPAGKDKLANEIKNIKIEGKTTIVSLLTNEEINRLNLNSEAELCEANSIDFIHYPIMDMSIPGFRSFTDFIEVLFSKTETNDNIIIHCKHGIGRSGLIALGLLIRNGEKLNSSIANISKIRGFDIPQSTSQRKLLSAYYLKKNQ